MKENKRIFLKYIGDEIKELKIFFLIGIALLIISSIIPFTTNSKINVDNKINYLKDKAEEIKNKTFLEKASFIFFNNLLVAYMVILLGCLFISAGVIISNGLIIGTVIKSTGNLSNIIYLIPHGIFEISAIGLAFALGIRLAFSIFKIKYKIKVNVENKIKDKHKQHYNTTKSFKTILLRTLKTSMIVVVLLLIASIIESSMI